MKLIDFLRDRGIIYAGAYGWYIGMDKGMRVKDLENFEVKEDE